MPAWNHNAARHKPLGRPTKERALLETVHWDTMGNPSCTCDRGRLFFGAPCVHKMVLRALEGPRQASHISLQRGNRVVEAPCTRPGERVFGVYWNVASPGPQRTMVHFDDNEQFAWYCEGRQAGCSKVGDCSHIVEVKRALQRPDGVHRLEGRLFLEAQLDRAMMSIRQEKSVMRVEGQKAAANGTSVACVTEAPRPSEGQEAHLTQDEPDALRHVEKYLLELNTDGHDEAACKGDTCFCKQHPWFCGGVDPDNGNCTARCCNSVSASGKRARSEQTDGNAAAGARLGVKRRGKNYWAANEH
jgi:hypothetical protein